MFRSFTIRSVCALAASWLLAACNSPTASEAQELFGRTSYDSTAAHYVSPFAATYVEQAMFYGRTVARSAAFNACISNTLNARYVWQSGDPLPGATRAAQAAEAIARLHNYDNNMHFLRGECPGGSACAYVTPPDYSTHSVFLATHEETYPDWSWYGAGGEPWQPWHWRTSEMIHEYMHTQGYSHTTADAGETSVPYIFSSCGANLISESWESCGDIRQGCGTGSLLLLAGWTGYGETEQSDQGACTCVRDPRHVVGLRTHTGTALTATSGGGSTLSTNWTSAYGAWQWFYAFDRNGGLWQGTDDVWLRSFNGPFVRPTASGWMADSTTPVDVRVTPVSAGSVNDGTVVQMSSGATYAANNGSTLAAVSTNGAANQLLTVVEPRRAHLVYLRTYHGTYVNRDASMALYNQRTNAELSGTNAAVKASAAFWVIDWNGGELQDGDWISLESFENSSYHYASVIDGDHTGHARLANAVTAYEKFRINILNGATGSVTYSNDGAANDNNVVSLQSSHGTFLTAMPANYYSSQIRNYGPYEGDWQRFEIVFVQEFDRHRPTW